MNGNEYGTSEETRERTQQTYRSPEVRYYGAQKQHRLRIARIRALIILIAVVVILFAVTFLTPLFDIKSITVTGNQYVSAAQISEMIGDIKGTNLFTARSGSIKKRLKENLYIDEVKVSKVLFPPTVNLEVTEHIPVGYVQFGSAFYVLDSDMYILDDGSGIDLGGLTCVTGIKIKKAEKGKTLVFENEEQENALGVFFRILGKDGFISKIETADFSSLDNITFMYDGRITAVCGSYAELDKKLSLFRETVTNENLGDSAKGTIDLTTVGQATYTP